MNQNTELSLAPAGKLGLTEQQLVFARQQSPVVSGSANSTRDFAHRSIKLAPGHFDSAPG